MTERRTVEESKVKTKKYNKRKSTTNQQVFDYVIPRILKQGRCWAPGFGCRYELAPGHYWTGEIYKEATVLSRSSLTPRYLRNLKDEAKDGVVTKFAGDRVYKREKYPRYSITRMFFVDRPKKHPYYWKEVYTDIVEGKTCDSGFMFSVLSRLGLDVDFFRALQVIHDDLTINTKGDWIKAFDSLSQRFALESGVRNKWMSLVKHQQWDYHTEETQRAIHLYS
jgi:hypothetical protein